MAKGIPIYGKKFLALRDVKLFSREALARASGVSAENIRRIETSEIVNVHPDTLRKLAAGLQMSDGEMVERVRVPGPLLQVFSVEAILTIGGHVVRVSSKDGGTVQKVMDVLCRDLGATVDVTVTDFGEEEDDAGPAPQVIEIEQAIREAGFAQDAADTDPTVPRGVIRSVGGVTPAADAPAGTSDPTATRDREAAEGGKPSAKSPRRAARRRKSAKGGKRG